MNIGIAIKSIRIELGFTQHDLAKRCAITQTSLSQIENGIKNPSYRTIKKVCEVLEIPPSVLYIMGMQETDVPGSQKDMYELLFPAIKSLALHIVGSEYKKFFR